MATSLNFKKGLDLPLWRPLSPAITAPVAGGSLAWDMRNDASRHPLTYLLRSSTALDCYSPANDDWMPLASPALAGTFTSGATAIMHPSQGPRGTLAAGSTTTTVVLSTALPTAVGLNQLADRGDGVGFTIRIITNTAGGAGKIEERKIVGNTAGTTPTLTLDSALSGAPASGAAYEILSGRVFMLSAGTAAAGVWKHYDIATNSLSGNLSITNLPATIGTDSAALALAEVYVSSDRVPGSGFVSGGATYDAAARNCIQATAAGATTITGSGMPASLIANEYTNFQVRVVEDTTTPTAVGQRRVISSHTSGATGVFTVAAWAVTPSATAKFVIENNDDLILLRSSATTSVYAYSISGNTWSTATFAAAGNAHGAGVVLAQAFGIPRDPTGNRRHSHIFCIRGGVSASIDMLDIANGANGTWSNDIAYGGKAQTFATGTSGAYDPVTLAGQWLHLNVNGTQRFTRFNMLAAVMEPETYLRFPQGSAAVGQKVSMHYLIDGATKLALLDHLTQSQVNAFSLAIQG